MQAKFFQYTMDSIMQIFFGEIVDTMGGEDNKYAAGYDTAHRSLITYFLKSIPALTLAKFAPWPFGGNNGWLHKIHRNSHPLFKEFKQSYATLDSESRRMVAGRDTTACTLSWMFYILATHPEIQQKLQAEIDVKHDADQTLTIKSLSSSELPYMNGLIYET